MTRCSDKALSAIWSLSSRVCNLNISMPVQLIDNLDILDSLFRAVILKSREEKNIFKTLEGSSEEKNYKLN